MDDAIVLLRNDLEKLTRLIAVALTAGKGKGEQIELLAKAGLKPKEIAGLIGTTANSVRVTLSGMRKSNKKGDTGEER